MAVDHNKILDLSKSKRLSTIMPDLIQYASEINDLDFKQWLTLEYLGYYKENLGHEDSITIPEYRLVPGQFFDNYQRPLIIQNPKLAFINTITLAHGVGELENFASGNKFWEINDVVLNNMILEKLKVQVNYFSFHSTSVVGILDHIRNQLLSKIIEKIRHADSQKQSVDNAVFHPLINRASGKLFEDGHYRNAILDAYIVLIDAVKSKSGKYDLDGTALMQTVFSPRCPILKVSDNLDEQQGYMWMFSGAVMAIRNSHAHKMIKPETRQEAIEWLGFASVLLKILDRAELIKKEFEQAIQESGRVEKI